MAKTFNTVLLSEDWSGFPVGHLHRDNTARGEYMTMVVPANPGGWYHNCNAGGPDREHSVFAVRTGRGGRTVGMAKPARAWTPLVVLTQGERPWRDFVVAAPVSARGDRPVGVAGRYRTNRDFYAAVFEAGMFKLVRVLEGAVTVLDSVPMPAPRKAITVSLRLDGDRLEASAGKARLAGRDGCIRSGGIGLWAMSPCTFGKVTVKTTPAEKKRVERARRTDAARAAKKARSLPPMELVAEIDVAGNAIGRQIRFADLDGGGRRSSLRYRRTSRAASGSTTRSPGWRRWTWTAGCCGRGGGSPKTAPTSPPTCPSRRPTGGRGWRSSPPSGPNWRRSTR